MSGLARLRGLPRLAGLAEVGRLPGQAGLGGGRAGRERFARALRQALARGGARWEDLEALARPAALRWLRERAALLGRRTGLCRERAALS
ncbi:hypothetical protein ACFQYP_07435 [Nonomuraea antimicrobica]